MTSSEELDISNQIFCPIEAKPPALTWLRMTARRAGNACLAALAKPVTGPVLIASVCLATVAYNKRKCTPCQSTEAAPEAMNKRTVLHRSMSIAALHGGKVVLERLLDAQEARIDTAGLEQEVEKMKTLISAQPIRFKELHVGKLIRYIHKKKNHHFSHNFSIFCELFYSFILSHFIGLFNSTLFIFF
jgi:hypothetical protein